MLNVQMEHLDDMISLTTDRCITRLNHMLHSVLFPNIPCEVCNRTWDSISPCALCNATQAVSSFRI